MVCVVSPNLFVLFTQNFLRDQNNKTNYNLVCETLQFLDCICGSTTGGLGLLGLYINERNVDLVNQTLETITEYSQGPCHENQVSNPPLQLTNVFPHRLCELISVLINDYAKGQAILHARYLMN